MNIVELILKLLGGDTLKQLSSVLGESPEAVQKALAAIVPTLLSGVGGLASKPQGAEKLWNSLRSVDDSLSDNLGSVIAKGGAADELTKKGTNILEDLMGKQSLLALIGPIAKFLAGNTALVSKLLPMVAPIILSVLGKQVKSGGLDLAGLLKLLLSQQGNISRAIPADLAKGLAGIQGLGDLTSFASGAAAAVGSAGSEAAKGINWLLPLLALAALVGAFLYWSNFVKPPVKVVEAVSPDTSKMPKPETLVPVKPGVEGTMNPVKALTENLTGYFKSIDGELDGITDEATAKAAVPKLEELAGQFDNLSGLFNKLPEAGRGGLLSLLEGGQKSLQEKAERVIGIPGVGELLKPLLDGLLEKLAALIKG